MTKPSRGHTLWNEARPFAAADLRDALDGPLDVIRDQLADKAPKTHTHARADVAGLPALLTAANDRLTALETAVAAIKQHLGMP